jgi:hypothetical protein
LLFFLTVRPYRVRVNRCRKVLLDRMLETKVHLGPRSAGNKSLLSYRAGHGITGYGGYCPSSESIPIPIKEGPSSSGAEVRHQRAPNSVALIPSNYLYITAGTYSV